MKHCDELSLLYRKSLSAVKGGKLARLISPAKTVSLILSDIIGDPLDFIASGPTVLQTEDPQERLRILEKYGLQLSEELLEVIARDDYSSLSGSSDVEMEAAPGQAPATHISDTPTHPPV